MGSADTDLYTDANFNFTYPDDVAKAYIAAYVREYNIPAVTFGAFATDGAHLLVKALATMGAYHGGAQRTSATFDG